MTGRTGASFEGERNNMLSEHGRPVCWPPGLQEGVLAVFPYSHIPGNNLSGCHDAGADRIAAERVGRQPQMRVALYRKYFGVSESGSGPWPAEAEEAQGPGLFMDLPGYRQRNRSD